MYVHCTYVYAVLFFFFFSNQYIHCARNKTLRSKLRLYLAITRYYTELYRVIRPSNIHDETLNRICLTLSISKIS